MTLPAGEVGQDTGQKLTILIVEDDALARISVAQHLRDVGYAVIEAGTANEAVSVLSSGSRVHLVFADVEMPGSMGGFSLAIWIRNHCRFIPVVLTSGVASVVSPLNRQGLIPFLEKPYRPQEAERLIASVLSSSSSVKRSEE